MGKLRGFKFSFNLSTNKKQNEFDDYSYQPQYSTLTGAYKVYTDEFYGRLSLSPPINKITPSMVELPKSREQPKPNSNQQTSQSDSQTGLSQLQQPVKSILKTQQPNQDSSLNVQVQEGNKTEHENDDYSLPPPIMAPKSAIQVSSNPEGAESHKTTKQNTKQQKKNHKALDKERKRIEKQQAAEAKRLATEEKKRKLELKKQQEKEAKIAQRKERENKKKTNSTPEQQPESSKRSANPLAQNSNPLAQAPQPSKRAINTTPTNQSIPTTLESTISRTKGPPPYNEVVNSPNVVPDIMPSKIDATGNTTFSKPVDFGSWDLVSQHRQAIGRPAASVSNPSSGKPKKIVMDMQFKVNDQRASEIDV